MHAGLQLLRRQDKPNASGTGYVDEGVSRDRDEGVKDLYTKSPCFPSNRHDADPLEPERVAQAITEWGLDYVVLTR